MEPVKASAQEKDVPKPEEVLKRPDNQTVRGSDDVANRKTTHPPAAPIQKVLHIVEIVENILKYLSEADLLFNAQATCKNFRETISGSVTLQQLLWQVPEGIPQIWTWDHESRTPVTGSAAHKIIEAVGPGKAASCTIYALNPLLLEVFVYGSSPKCAHRRLEHELCLRQHNMARLATNLRASSALIPMASCRGMHIARPPIGEVIIRFFVRKQKYLSWEEDGDSWYPGSTDYHAVRNENGIRFGELIDVIGPKTLGPNCWLENIIVVGGFPVTTEEQAIFALASEITYSEWTAKLSAVAGF
ncbi:hypothetical protein K491DRAFT_713745 [Lophiostoma macrostomum CBS 122681]|uniref:F-box domain-containing protein n=1 Tax=Lophiostoma macrostomum CBS 122681 TaxID=1314788 RepID=A0A6A6TE85_9PLEO|nr:hypothetical protein K491DRAFT_713745 [Lophiostoma macrostomum CBS 122681]